jgi:hypothetical protein
VTDGLAWTRGARAHCSANTASVATTIAAVTSWRL